MHVAEAKGNSCDDATVCGVSDEGGTPAPPLLTLGETKARRLGESETLLIDDAFNKRHGPKANCQCQHTARLVVVGNDSNNCFASVTLLALTSLACKLRRRWPEPEEVVPHARPFFRLVQALKERHDDLKQPGTPRRSSPETFKV